MGSPYHTVHGSDTNTMHGVAINPLSENLFRQHRSNSWSDSLDDGKMMNNARGGHEGGTSDDSDGNGGGYLATRENWNATGKTPFRGVILDPTMSRKILMLLGL